MPERNCLALAVTLALLAGCAARTPEIALDQRGSLPQPASIQLIGAAEASESENSVINGLAAEGYRSADPAKYLVQLSVTELSAKTGLFVPDTIPDNDNGWLVSPGRSRSQVTRRAVLSFTNAADGEEVYRLSATGRFRIKHPGTQDQLVGALMDRFRANNLPPQGPKAAERK